MRSIYFLYLLIFTLLNIISFIRHCQTTKFDDLRNSFKNSFKKQSTYLAETAENSANICVNHRITEKIVLPIKDSYPKKDHPCTRGTKGSNFSKSYQKQIQDQLSFDQQRQVITKMKGGLKDLSILKQATITGIRESTKYCIASDNQTFYREDYAFRELLKYTDVIVEAFMPVNFTNFRMLTNMKEVFEATFKNALLKSIKTTGKGGASFFSTLDKKFFIKTLDSGELDSITEFLPEYFKHFCEHPNTLLPDYSGLYAVKLNKKSPIFFIVFSNLYPFMDDPIEKYDIKGSNRKASDPGDNGCNDLKEGDFLRNFSNGIKISPGIYAELTKTLEADTEFLWKHNIVDYSLLMVKAKTSKNTLNLNILRRGIQATADGHKDIFIVYIGFIDILQKYNLLRKIEGTVSNAAGQVSDKHVSSIKEPELYANRLIIFVTKRVFKDNDGPISIPASTPILANDFLDYDDQLSDLEHERKLEEILMSNVIDTKLDALFAEDDEDFDF